MKEWVTGTGKKQINATVADWPMNLTCFPWNICKNHSCEEKLSAGPTLPSSPCSSKGITWPDPAELKIALIPRSWLLVYRPERELFSVVKPLGVWLFVLGLQRECPGPSAVPSMRKTLRKWRLLRNRFQYLSTGLLREGPRGKVEPKFALSCPREMSREVRRVFTMREWDLELAEWFLWLMDHRQKFSLMYNKRD